jgi:hypothetical protein
MKASTSASLPILWASPRLKTRVSACQPQYNLAPLGPGLRSAKALFMFSVPRYF